MESLRFPVLTAFALALLTACNTAATVKDPEPDNAEKTESLYSSLEARVQNYDALLQQFAADPESLDLTQLSTILNGIHADADECGALSGCDTARFTHAYHDLLNQQTDMLFAYMNEDPLTPQTDESLTGSDVVAAGGLPQMDRTLTLLRGTEFSDVIPLNRYVKAAMDDWLTWRRPQLMEAWENYQFLKPLVLPPYEDAGLPEALVFAVIAKESLGRVHSTSRAGARGPFQFMRHTGRRYGLTADGDFDMRLDPAAAAMASVAYLNDQLEVFNENMELALAAYNGGETRVRRLYQRSGRASFWDTDILYALPRETRDYVPLVMGAAWLFLHPEDYNLEFPAYEYVHTVMELPVTMSLGEITICLGQPYNRNGWFRTLRNLNPRIEATGRIEAGEHIVIPEVLVPVFEERCHDQELLARAEELHAANYPDGSEMEIYIVQRGDTVSQIARRHRCTSIRELAAVNNIRPPRYMIRVGQSLKVPVC